MRLFKRCDGGEDVDTVLESHFDSPSGRLLTFSDTNALESIVDEHGPMDVVFVMVNTEKYGGAGTVLHTRRVHRRALPAPTFAAQDTTSFQIAVHELGHSMAGLADEYEDQALVPRRPLPTGERDLPDPNVTVAGRFDDSSFETLKTTLKWKRFLELPGARKHKWIHEGGYYRAEGVFRPWRTCKMLKNEDVFCPVCCEAMAKAIFEFSGGTWDEVQYHKEHKLKLWRK